jgi:ABC-type uncharacterized transport system permease subunit
MNKHIEWISHKLWLGRIFLIAGLLVGVAGIALPRVISDLQFNARIITGLGILLLGIGIAYLVRYGAARRDVQAARRMVSEERDERMQSIRARAGNRAYWASTALAYIGLMWVSFAESGSLPPLSGDAFWYLLAAVVVLPFCVYAGSLIYDEKSS